jgi:hypothetical protein
MSRESAGAYFADHPRLKHESAALRDGRFWRKAVVKNGKTGRGDTRPLSAKSRSASEISE